MRTSGWGLVLVVVMLLAPRAASAESKEELAKDFEPFIDFVPEPGAYTTVSDLGYPKESYRCRDHLARATKALGPDDELVSPRFGGHPKARKVGDVFAIKVSELGWICTTLSHRLDEIRLAGMMALGKAWEGHLARGFTDEDRKMLTASEAALMDRMASDCKVVVVNIQFMRTIEEVDGKRGGAPAPHEKDCATIEKWNDIYQAEWTARRAILARPYEDAAIGGDRLETLLSKAPALYYAPEVDGWVIEGCKLVKSVKQLKKAKELVYVQTTRDDKIVLLRFQFKGDEILKRTSATFPTAKAAFKTRCRI